MKRERPIRTICALIVVGWMVLAGCFAPTPHPTPLPSPAPGPTPLPVAEWVAEGDAALARSDFAGAERAYRRAAEGDPDYAPAHVGLAWLASWQAGGDRQALAEARRATELDPADAGGWVVLGEMVRRREEPAEAIRAAERAVQLAPGSSLARAVLARAYLEDRQYDAALKAAGEAVQLDPASAYAYEALSRVHEGMADFGRARAAVEQAVLLEPQFAPWRCRLGKLLCTVQRYGEAQGPYEQALRLVPNYTCAILGQAAIHTSKQEYEEAEKLYAQAASAAPNAPEPLVYWAYLDLIRGDQEEGMAKLDEAAALDPGNWWVESARLNYRTSTGNCETAEAVDEQLLLDHPRDGALRLSIARTESCLNHPDRALELAQEAADLEPYSVDAYWVQAWLYGWQRRWDDALWAFFQAARFDPLASGEHASLADAYLNQGKLDEAEEEARLATQLDPSDSRGFAALCSLYMRSNQPHKMLAPCEQAMKLDPRNLEGRCRWGAALALNDRSEEAVDVLAQTVAEDPEHALSHLYLGLANLQLKRYVAAQSAFETYESLVRPNDERVEWLISFLDQGWEIPEAEILDDLELAAEEVVRRPANWRIESQNPLTRTLAAEIRADVEEAPEAVFEDALDLLALASHFLTRTVPEINGGTAVRVADAEGRPLFELEVGAREQWHYATLQLSRQGFNEQVEFVQSVGETHAPAMLDELVKTAGADIAELRGLAARQPVPIEQLTLRDLEARLEASVDEEDRQEARNHQLLLALLGALDPGVDILAVRQDLMREQAFGLYDGDDKTLLVIGDQPAGPEDRVGAAAEYLHALQDQHFGIGKPPEGEMNDDRRMAYDALAEGDNSLTTVLYAQEALSALELMLTLEAPDGKAQKDRLEKMPDVLRGWIEFPYNEGMLFVEQAYRSGGWEAVNDLYDRPPASTEQVLHPERYRAGEAPVEVTLPDLTNALGHGWQVAYENVLGEWTWRLALAQVAGPALAERAAGGWGGDRYTLLRHEDSGAGAVLIRTAWDTLEDADEFWAVIRNGLAGRPGFSEVVRDLTGPGHTRYFQGPDVFWIVRLDGSNVTLTIGPTEEIAAKLDDAAGPDDLTGCQ